MSTTRFDENVDLSTTYLGRSDRAKCDKLKAREAFFISEQEYALGKLLDGTECQLLLDTGASKSFMSKSYYIHCKSLHSLPKFASKTQRIQLANGQYVSVLFIISSNYIHSWTQVWNIYIGFRDPQKCRFSFRHKECF